jgi:hypothetical protein
MPRPVLDGVMDNEYWRKTIKHCSSILSGAFFILKPESFFLLRRNLAASSALSLHQFIYKQINSYGITGESFPFHLKIRILLIKGPAYSDDRILC